MCSQRGGKGAETAASRTQLLRRRIWRLLGLETISSSYIPHHPVPSSVVFQIPPRVPTISVQLSSSAPTPDSISTELDLSGPVEGTSFTDSWVTVGGRRSLVACKIQALVEAFANRAQSVKARIAQPPTPSPSPPPDEDEQHDGRPRLESLINPGEESNWVGDPEPKKYWVLGCIKVPALPTAWEPQSTLYLSWLFVVVLCYLYNAWFIFLRAIFPYQTPALLPLFLTLDYICDFVYLMDVVVVKVRIKYLDNGVWVNDFAKTRRNYFQKRIFKMDAMSLLPLDFFYFLFGVNPLFRLPRLLKLQTFWEFFQRIDALAKSPFIIRIIHTLLYMMFLIHAESCAYYAMSTWEGIGYNNWVFQGIGNAYIRCFYFATKTATSIGRNPKPENEYEYVFMTFSWLMGVFVFAFLIGQIRDIVATATQSKTQYRQLMDQSVRYLRNLDLPEDLQRRVRLWLNHTWQQQKTFNESNILDSLPIKMKTDVAISVHYKTLAKVQIFKDCDRCFLRDLVHKIRPVLFLPGDHVCRKGEIGKEMYIVNSGEVLVLGGEKSNNVLATLTEGSVFGEISLLGLEGFTRRTADVRSRGYSNLFVLSKDDLWDALKTYPEAEAILKRKAKSLIQQNKERAEATTKKKNSITASAIIKNDAPRRRSTPRLVRTVMQVVPPDSRCAVLLRGISVHRRRSIAVEKTTEKQQELEVLVKKQNFTIVDLEDDEPILQSNSDTFPIEVTLESEQCEIESNYVSPTLDQEVTPNAVISPNEESKSSGASSSLSSSVISLRSFFRNSSSASPTIDRDAQSIPSRSQSRRRPGSMDSVRSGVKIYPEDFEKERDPKTDSISESWSTNGYDNLTFVPQDLHLNSRSSSLVSDLSF